MLYQINNYFVTIIKIKYNPLDQKMSENIMGSKLEENSGNENNSENEVCVFLMTQNGLPVTLDNNAAVTTQEILNKFYHELAKQSIIKGEVCDVKHVCGKFFTLWMTSPYLELQLTPLQRPFVLLNKWDELLLKYAPPDVCKNRDLIEKDEPILSFQRSVYAKKEDETKLEAKDFDVLRLLYEEAKFHILDGRYPYEKYEELAAIQAAIEIDEKIDSQEFFRKHLDKFVPIQYHKMLENNLLGNIFNISLNRICHKIFEDYKEIIKNAPSNYELFKYKLIRSYLERCWNLPYYGSAYFNGQIEKPVKGFASILSHFDIPIWIAVNRMGIHIIDKKTSVSLIIIIIIIINLIY